MKKTSAKKQVSKSKIVKKAPVKKVVAKTPAKKAVAKAPAKKQPVKKTKPEQSAKKAVVKEQKCTCTKGGVCKTNPNKKCCGKKDCKCKNNLAKVIAEISTKLNDVKVVESVIQDFFFIELVDRGFNVEDANAITDKIVVNVESLDAYIDMA
ncbi:MAG: hypothetical protein J6B07_01770 [Opitutales bacterium]|nr:hypothetical protein [Opitutales bacterium]